MGFISSGGSGGGGGGGGGGSSFVLPTACVPNSVLQIPVTGAPFAAPVGYDELAAAFSVTLSANRALDVGDTLTHPSFTAGYSSTPVLSAVLSDNAGSASKDVTSTPNAFASDGTFTRSTDGASVYFTLTANAGGATHYAAVSATWYPRIYWGTLTAAQLALSDSALAAAIVALSSQRTNGRTGTFSTAITSADFGVFAFRTTWGAPSFQLTGFLPGGVSKIKSGLVLTNAFGVAQPYDIWRVDEAGLGGAWIVT